MCFTALKTHNIFYETYFMVCMGLLFQLVDVRAPYTMFVGTDFPFELEIKPTYTTLVMLQVHCCLKVNF